MSKIQELENYFKLHPEIKPETRQLLRHTLIQETEMNGHSSNINWLLEGKNNLEITLKCIETDQIMRKQYQELKKEKLEFCKNLEKKLNH